MYLAALGPQNPYVSTYFTVFLDPVGGGGSAQKSPRQKRRQKRKLSSVKQTLPTSTTMLFGFGWCAVC